MKMQLTTRKRIGKIINAIRSCAPILKADIAAGLRRDEFLPVFQPAVEFRTGQLAGFEVLACWDHRRRGPLMPADFISGVERSGPVWATAWDCSPLPKAWKLRNK